MTRLARSPGRAPSRRTVTHVEVWSLEGARLWLLERRTIAPAVKRWAGDRVAYFDLDTVHLVLTEVIRKYAPDLLSRRCGARWRSRRRPAGWPVVARFAIPWLYDYLRPFYRARRYRHRRKHPSAGNYPTKLREDIRNVLRFERPDLGEGLALAHVTAAIQYHLRTAPSNRLMGKKLCAELHRRKPKKNDVTF